MITVETCYGCGSRLYGDDVCTCDYDILLNEYHENKIQGIYDTLDVIEEGYLPPRVTVKIDPLDGFHTVTL